MRDTLADGRKFRLLNIVDDFSRENPAIEVDTSLPGQGVVRVLEWLRELRACPRRSSSITDPSSPAWLSMNGRISTGSSCTSSNPASHPERLHRKLQRQAARRVPQRQLLHVAGRRAGQDRSMAHRVQS